MMGSVGTDPPLATQSDLLPTQPSTGIALQTTMTLGEPSTEPQSEEVTVASPAVSLNIPAPATKPQLVAGKFEVIRVNLAAESSVKAIAVPVESLVNEEKRRSDTVDHPAPTTVFTPTSITAHNAPVKAPLIKGEEDDDDEESDDDKDSKHRVVEISPCIRYHKRRERVTYILRLID
jgi:hypothetical protein